jgi:hypothetical protein
MSTMRFAVSRPSSKGINWGCARNLQKSNRRSSLAGMTGPLSFRAVCGELEIDPEAVRQGLTRWAAERVAGRKPPMIQCPSLPAKRISGPNQLEENDARRFIHDASGSRSVVRS